MNWLTWVAVPTKERERATSLNNCPHHQCHINHWAGHRFQTRPRGYKKKKQPKKPLKIAMFIITLLYRYTQKDNREIPLYLLLYSCFNARLNQYSIWTIHGVKYCCSFKGNTFVLPLLFQDNNLEMHERGAQMFGDVLSSFTKHFETRAMQWFTALFTSSPAG